MSTGNGRPTTCRFTDNALWVKALSFVAGDAAGNTDPGYDFTTFPEVVASAADGGLEAFGHPIGASGLRMP